MKYLGRGLPLREARIYGMIKRIDQNSGRLLSRIGQLGLADTTLVLFTSDNGGVSRFWKGGMNGAKSNPYEGGIRAPLFVRWFDEVTDGITYGPVAIPVGRADPESGQAGTELGILRGPPYPSHVRRLRLGYD